MDDRIEKLRYPTGRFQLPEGMDKTQIDKYINEIKRLPEQLRDAVSGLNDEQLDTSYREDGWTVRQVIHHVADSHLNSYIRFRWSLTEETPTIKAYYEDRWAELDDARNAPVEISLKLLDALHDRWVMLLKNLDEEDLQKSFIHPESGKEVKLYVNIALYAWHSRHHLAHITELRNRKGW